MRNLITFIIFCFILNHTSAQITENFSDSNFTVNPVWSGDTSDWIVDTAGQLESNDSIANSSFYLSTANTLATFAQWEFFVRLAFNTSSANYADVFLTASANDLTDKNTTGYFIRMGNSEDNISLYRKDSSGVSTKIFSGTSGILNKANNLLKIKVTRSSSGEWNLFTDQTSTGLNYVLHGTTTDSTYTTSAFFGFLVKQSSGSFFKKHYFDDIKVKPYVADTIPPFIVSVNAATNNTADVLFSEPADILSAQILTNYFVNNGSGNPVLAVRDTNNNSLVHLSFATAFLNGAASTITINNVKDISGNTLINGKAAFSFYTPHFADVVIDEILPDPNPVVGLPDAEFIEIKNTSGKKIDITGWKVTSLTSTSSPFPSYILSADSFLIIIGNSDTSLYSTFGKVLGIRSFPALNNNGTTLSLISKEGVTIHSVGYDNRWFRSDTKSGGGYSLEMIDTKNACTGSSNWEASADISGGTPGRKNSVDNVNPDNIAPALLRAAAIDSLHVVLTFSEPVDSAKAAIAANYTIGGAINSPVAAVTISPQFIKVLLTLAAPLTINKIYTITADNINDCSGNIINALKTVRLGLPSAPDSFDIVINEILFNPRPNSVDYVEVYNRSNKIINIKDLFIANRSSDNTLGSIHQITADDILMFPGDFSVFSENGNLVKQNYVAQNPDNFIDAAMPAFPDDKGVIVLLNSQKKVIDELHYSSGWHLALIDNQQGISLERIDYNKPTQDKNNWTSAASTTGFGTPSYQNSQHETGVSVKGDITVAPKTFSPDNDGFDDFITVHYQMSATGFAANITIFDASGRLVKDLAKNAILGLSGSFKWDGLDDKSNKVATGVYVIYTEIFNLNGKRKSFKNPVIVASKF